MSAEDELLKYEEKEAKAGPNPKQIIDQILRQKRILSSGITGGVKFGYSTIHDQEAAERLSRMEEGLNEVLSQFKSLHGKMDQMEQLLRSVTKKELDALNEHLGKM